MWVVGLIDPFYSQGSVLGSVSSLHVISAMTAIIMSGLVIAGLTFRPMGRILKSIGWISLILITLFAANSYILYIAQE